MPPRHCHLAAPLTGLLTDLATRVVEEDVIERWPVHMHERDAATDSLDQPSDLAFAVGGEHGDRLRPADRPIARCLHRQQGRGVVAGVQLDGVRPDGRLQALGRVEGDEQSVVDDRNAVATSASSR